jgi:hypothetical protein
MNRTLCIYRILSMKLNKRLGNVRVRSSRILRLPNRRFWTVCASNKYTRTISLHLLIKRRINLTKQLSSAVISLRILSAQITRSAISFGREPMKCGLKLHKQGSQR